MACVPEQVSAAPYWEMTGEPRAMIGQAPLVDWGQSGPHGSRSAKHSVAWAICSHSVYR